MPVDHGCPGTTRPVRRRRPLLALGLAGLVTATALSGTAGSASAATPACTSLTAPVYLRVNPTTNVTLLTTSQQESTTAATNGFTDDHGTPVTASTAALTGMTAVHRLYKASSKDQVWMTNPNEIASAVSKYGYTDQGTAFYSATAAGSGCVAVLRFVKGALHRFGVAADSSTLMAAGWKQEGTAFYGALGPSTPPGGGGGGGGGSGDPFTVAVLPDTQQWTMPNQTRFGSAVDYLVAQRSALNLKEVVQTGDLVNWGWLDPAQYTVASNALQTLESASVPYLLTIGNHDTRAVGWDGKPGSRVYGGAAYANNPECPERLGAAQCNTRLLVRHTEEFNARFNPTREQGSVVEYEDGKVDNQYSTFTAGGLKWLTLSLEFCPRVEVVDWAKSVVASHPDYNVIVSTHYFLEPDGTIGQNDQGYGAMTPQYLYDNLIKVYPNIKMTFSGHTKLTAYREDTGVNGNKIVSMMLTDLGENKSNAMRLVSINPTTGAVSSRIYAPNLNQTYPQYDQTSTLSFVS